jgi:hypothetical protein
MPHKLDVRMGFIWGPSGFSNARHANRYEGHPRFDFQRLMSEV